MKRIFPLVCCLLILACGSKSIPEWQALGAKQLEGYKQTALEGKTDLAAQHFRKAVAEVKKSGDLERLARVHLTRCAVQVALLEPLDDREYLEIAAVLPQPDHQAFHAMLKGEPAGVEAGRLPPRYQGFLKAWQRNDPSSARAEIDRMDDPLAVLIATGLLVKGRQYEAETLNRAIEVSSRNGWKKALLTYLDVQQASYGRSGDHARSELIRRKMDLLRD
jgi:hypothetical protein